VAATGFGETAAPWLRRKGRVTAVRSTTDSISEEIEGEAIADVLRATS
jgi:hypothetical protein